MVAIREPKSVKAATKLLDQYAELDGQIADIEANRTASIADVNTRCDTAANDLIKQRDNIRVKIESWWGKLGESLLADGKKSMELGGCMIGTRSGKRSLGTDDVPGVMVKRLKGLAWARPMLRTTVSLDKPAIMKALDGKKHAEKLGKAGFSVTPAAESFVLERAEQRGTRGGAK